MTAAHTVNWIAKSDTLYWCVFYISLISLFLCLYIKSISEDWVLRMVGKIGVVFGISAFVKVILSEHHDTTIIRYCFELFSGLIVVYECVKNRNTLLNS